MVTASHNPTEYNGFKMCIGYEGTRLWPGSGENQPHWVDDIWDLRTALASLFFLEDGLRVC